MHNRVSGRALIALAVLLAAGAAVAHQQSQSQRTAFFENDEVKVWRTSIPADQPLSMHRHDHPRVIVALAGGQLKVVPESGQSHTLDWESGKAYWLDADPPGQLHADVNAGAKPIEVIVVELKKSK